MYIAFYAASNAEDIELGIAVEGVVCVGWLAGQQPADRAAVCPNDLATGTTCPWRELAIFGTGAALLVWAED